MGLQADPPERRPARELRGKVPGDLHVLQGVTQDEFPRAQQIPVLRDRERLFPQLAQGETQSQVDARGLELAVFQWLDEQPADLRQFLADVPVRKQHGIRIPLACSTGSIFRTGHDKSAFSCSRSGSYRNRLPSMVVPCAPARSRTGQPGLGNPEKDPQSGA